MFERHMQEFKASLTDDESIISSEPKKREDNLSVRVLPQLHKSIWGNKRGV